MARYLVTGGGGFIGSNIVKELLKRGEYVRVLDNFSTGRRQNLAPFLKDIDLIEGDFVQYHIALKATRQIDYVLHQAALPSVPRSIADPISSNDVNIKGTLNLLHASVENNVRKFIFASSSSVYGNQPESPKVETMIPMPISPYAVSKITGEYYCKVFQQLYGLETVCLRYFNVFGPNQDPNSQYAAVIPKFIRMILSGQRPTVYGDGAQSRDFTYVANNVEANLLACDTPNGGGKVFNIACGGSFTLIDLVNQINTILGTSIEPNFLEPRNGDILHSKANIEKAQTDILYQVKVGFKEGLEKTIEYIKETEFNS